MASKQIDQIDETDAAAVEEAAAAASPFDVVTLRGIGSFADAVALAEQTYGDVIAAENELGSGFLVLPTAQKDRLVGVKFVILSMSFNQGDQGMFVSMMVVTEHGDRLIVNDGGTGIYAQLDEWHVRSNRAGGLIVNGLRKSEYDNEFGHGVTYYLNV